MEDKRIYLLKDAPVSKAINAMAIPAIIGMVVMAIYNIVDTMFVAWLGTDSTAATQVVMPVMMLVSAIGLSIGMGGGGYISRLLGSNDKQKANEVGSVSIVSAFILGITSTLLLTTFLEPILIFFGATQDVLVKAKEYGFFIALGSAFTISNMTMNNLLRGDGSAKLSMLAMAVGTLINIALDPIFIFTLGLGIKGAAIATTISQGITFSILLSQYIRKKAVVEVKFSYFKPTKEMFSEIMKIGIPTFIRQLLFSISVGFLNQAATSQGGGDLLAATGLIFRISMLPMYFIFGLAQGFQPVVGYAFGAKNKKRVMESLKYTLIAGFVIAVISALIIILLDSIILSIFKPAENVLKLGKTGLFYAAITFLLMSGNNTVSVFFQSIGRGKESITLATARQGFLFIPLCFILPNIFGTNGVFMVMPGADLFTLILSGTLMLFFIRKHRSIVD